MISRAFVLVLLFLVSVGAYPYGGNLTDVRESGWSYPVDYQSYETCAQFGQYGGHVGVDLCRDVGTEVFAIDGGCVEAYNPDASDYGGTSGQKGGVVLLRHVTSGGRVFYAVYGHVTLDTEYLKERMCSDGPRKEVEKGHRIGWVLEYVGGANHLHFGIHPDKKAEKIYQGNKCFSSDHCGWVDPVNDFLASSVPGSQQYATKNIPTQAKYGWVSGPGSDRCEDGTNHYRIDDVACYPVSKETACAGVAYACANPPSENQVASLAGTEKSFFPPSGGSLGMNGMTFSVFRQPMPVTRFWRIGLR